MKRDIVPWTAKDLYENREYIEYPEFQREPTVWVPKRKQLLIDSMLVGLDIPKIYLFSPDNDEYCPPGMKDAKGNQVHYYDCVDGQQRIVSVIEFFDGKLRLEDGRFWKDLLPPEQKNLLNYEFTIALIKEASDDDLRLLFLRLQLGAPLVVGEKLKVLKGDMRNFVFEVGVNHPFFVKLTIQNRRYTRETVFAQICINSFYRTLKGTFYTARYEELKAFFEQYSNLSNYAEIMSRIVKTLDLMNKYFAGCIQEFGNRATIVTGYLFFEELIKKGEYEKLPIFAKFYVEFLKKLTEQSGKGLDYDKEYRDLLNFQSYIIQAAVSKGSITARHEMVKAYFEYYLKTGQILKTTS
jgi:hypothetical protein